MDFFALLVCFVRCFWSSYVQKGKTIVDAMIFSYVIWTRLLPYGLSQPYDWVHHAITIDIHSQSTQFRKWENSQEFQMSFDCRVAQENKNTIDFTLNKWRTVRPTMFWTQTKFNSNSNQMNNESISSSLHTVCCVSICLSFTRLDCTSNCTSIGLPFVLPLTTVVLTTTIVDPVNRTSTLCMQQVFKLQPTNWTTSNTGAHALTHRDRHRII